MLNTLLEVNSIDKFTAFSATLSSADKLSDLYNSIYTSDIVMSSDDKYTTEEMREMTYSGDAFDSALASISREDKNVKTLHLLQLVGFKNPGMKKQIDRFLERSCV